MRKFMLVIGLLLLGQLKVWAHECPPGTTLQVIGTVQNGPLTEVVSVTGHKVQASRVSCGGTACVATAYDADIPGDSQGYTDANVKDEPGAAANTSSWTVYDPPLTFIYGIATADDGNVNGALYYECR